jgi:hypothetical protein
MKRTGFSSAAAMVPFLSMAVYMGAAAAASGQMDAAKSSVNQIRDTLHNLLRSIDDAGREADDLFGKRQKWCEATAKAHETGNQVARTSLEDMQAQLTEHEAESEEAAGTVQQVKVDIEMVQHTIKQTQDMLQEGNRLTQQDGQAREKLLRSLMENKKLSLSSLQGELEVAIPVLAQLEASVAETKQRISDRTQSMAAGTEFLSVFRDVCQAAADRADTQADARLGESSSIRVTLQALDKMEASRTASQENHHEVLTKFDEKDDAAQDAPPSFVQLADRSEEMTVDDLSDLFSDQQAAAKPAPPVRRTALPQQQARHTSASSLRPRIESLLSQLKTAGTTSDQSVWCSDQRQDSELSLKFSTDAVAQLSSEVDSHQASEAELFEELSTLKSSASAVATVSAKTLDFAKKEQAFIQNSRKDQQLATKILEQATTILKDMGVKNATAVHGLETAQKMLGAQIKAAAGFEKEALAKANVLAEKAASCTRTQESEEHNLEFAQDDHQSQRLSLLEKQRLYEADVKEASTYVQKLQESCKVDAEVEAKQQRSAQVHALEDADQALDGKLMEAKTKANSLRGGEAKAIPKDLTPMQRAAAEMGVAME